MPNTNLIYIHVYTYIYSYMRTQFIHILDTMCRYANSFIPLYKIGLG